MPVRRVIEVPGVEHSAPIPMGVRMGNMLFSSAVMGKDPATGELPSSPERQAELAFANLATLLERGGASPANLAHLGVLVRGDDMRKHVNDHWLRWFPDPNDRPARHTTVADLPGGMLVQLEAIAVLDTP
ncbi:MAG: RidA family protein [Streptosporangiales bacterium]|nr:RidA family protein [Streptosporangiales bacterium]